MYYTYIYSYLSIYLFSSHLISSHLILSYLILSIYPSIHPSIYLYMFYFPDGVQRPRNLQ